MNITLALEIDDLFVDDIKKVKMSTNISTETHKVHENRYYFGAIR